MGEWCKTQLPTTSWLIPTQSPRSSTHGKLSPSLWNTMPHGMEYPFCQFESAVQIASPPSILCASGLLVDRAVWGKKGFNCVTTVHQQLKHQRVINTIFITNPKPSTVEATMKTITLSQPPSPHSDPTKSCRIVEFTFHCIFFLYNTDVCLFFAVSYLTIHCFVAIF